MTMHDPEHDIERLISSAGWRNAPGAERSARVRGVVAQVWRQEIARRRARRQALAAAATLLAAAAVLTAIFRPAATIDPPNVTLPQRVASIAAASGRVLLNGSTTPDGNRPGAALESGTRLETAVSASATLRFDAGAELRIHNDTALRLDGPRSIALDRGTIYLDAGESAAGGYTVTAAGGIVLRDIGTRFEVQLTEGALRLRVRDGEVLLESARQSGRAAAGEELEVNREGDIVRRKVPPFGPDWDWTTRAAPVFTVENATLEAFLDWAIREGGWMMDTPADAAFRQLARTTRLHGDISGLTPREALAVVLPTCGLTIAFSGGRAIVRKPSSEGVPQ
jgi:ferric-dicitrate binding protein FerR (iron transport regulator)